MIIASRGGHNPQSQGANGILNEVTEDRLINAAVIKYLRILGHDSRDVTPGNLGVYADLVHGVQMANLVLNADIFNSNHLNASRKTIEAMGCECVTYGDAPSVEIANRITDNLVKVGFKRRPNKINKELYEVKATVMPSVIVEPFFVDSEADVALYKKIGPDEIGRAIAYGLVGSTFNIKTPVVFEEGWLLDSRGWWYQNTDGSYPKKQWIMIDNEWYYFNEEGYASIGWSIIGDKEYFFDSNCKMQSNQWKNSDDRWYYLSPSGEIMKGWIKVNNKNYFLNPITGLMAVNTVIEGFKIGPDGAVIL